MPDDDERDDRDQLVESEKTARRREKALQNDLAIVKSQLAVKDEKLKAAVRGIAVAKAANRESNAAHVAQLTKLREGVTQLAQHLGAQEREFAKDLVRARGALSRAARDLQVTAGDAFVAASCSFDAKCRELEAVRAELQTAQTAERSAADALENACEEKNKLIAKSNSLQRTLESLKHDLGRMTRESEKQRCATQQLRMSLTEAIEDRDKALAAKEEWREVASFPGTVEKLDKVSAKEHE
mmetsp:Transcript_5650/g.14551  ORF Transcript_5650/g.14551 Transcript_5650/m.14551 type:complete len:241 (-) Transcript_5650:61-783(-)